MSHSKWNRVLASAAGLSLVALTLLPGAGFQAAAAPASSGPSAPQDTITVTAPNNVTIPESDDYATQVLGDPWDMNNPEDVKAPYGYSAPSVSGGVWTATATTNNSTLFLQYQGIPTTYSYVGEKSGTNYPIDTQRFTHLVVRMNLSQAGRSNPMVAYWFKNPNDTAPCNNCHSALIQPVAGWHVYDIDLNGNGGTWSSQGTVAGLRFDAPLNISNNQVSIDWARLTPGKGATVNIAGQASTNASSVSIYLSTDPNGANDNELLIGTATITRGQFSYQWQDPGLAPGTYYIHVTTGNGWGSSGPLHVNTAPVVQFDAPSPLSGEDWAQATLGQEWNGSNQNQFAAIQNVTNLSFNNDYWQGTSQTLPGNGADPNWYWLYNNGPTIDTNRYRYADVKLFLASPASRPQSPFNLGPRFFYSHVNSSDQTATTIAIAPYNVWLPLSFDMSRVPNADGSPSTWTAAPADMFRFDPHEADDAYGQPAEDLPFFRIGGAHLKSQPIAGPSTLIRWHKYQGTGTVSFFYDSDNSGFNGTPISSAQNVSIDQGAVGWNTSALPQGANLYVYAVATDGINTSRYYSVLPIHIDHNSSSTIFDDVPTNYSLANYVNDLAVRGIINGYPQFDSTLLFRPGNSATRAQLSKMVVLGAGYRLVRPNSPTFMDVPTDSPLYAFVETAAANGIISGYRCGGSGEPCDGSGRNYFRPNANVTRAQTTKMISISRGWAPVSPSTPSFRDIDSSSPLYGYVEAAVQHHIISGYSCGAPGEPCPGAYFRPNANVTRAQISKMLSLALPPLPAAPGGEK